MNDPHPHILVLEDAEEILELCRDLLHGEGYRVSTCPTGAATVDLMMRTRPDLVMLGMVNGESSHAARLLPQIGRDPRLATIPVLTSAPCAALARLDPSWQPRPRIRFVEKPRDVDELLAKVSDCLGDEGRRLRFSVKPIPVALQWTAG